MLIYNFFYSFIIFILFYVIYLFYFIYLYIYLFILFLFLFNHLFFPPPVRREPRAAPVRPGDERLSPQTTFLTSKVSLLFFLFLRSVAVMFDPFARCVF